MRIVEVVPCRPCVCGSLDFELIGRSQCATIDRDSECVCCGCGLSYALATTLHPDKPKHPIAHVVQVGK